MPVPSSSSTGHSMVLKITEMKSFPRSDEAKVLLERVARDCAPLMKRRGWTVKHLQEFYPQNDGLLGLNVNRGAAIKIRLRQTHDQTSFFSYEDHILGTMVHELTHMVESSHSSRFYKLMDELHDEVDKDMAGMSSYAGTSFVPFQGKGTRLGNRISTSTSSSLSSFLPTTVADRRQLMANAAIHRNSFHTLGGKDKGRSKPSTREELRKVAADAAIRRARDDLWCPGEDSTDANGSILCIEIDSPIDAVKTARGRSSNRISNSKIQTGNENTRSSSGTHEEAPRGQSSKRASDSKPLEVIDLVSNDNGESDNLEEIAVDTEIRNRKKCRRAIHSRNNDSHRSSPSSNTTTGKEVISLLT